MSPWKRVGDTPAAPLPGEIESLLALVGPHASYTLANALRLAITTALAAARREQREADVDFIERCANECRDIAFENKCAPDVAIAFEAKADALEAARTRLTRQPMEGA